MTTQADNEPEIRDGERIAKVMARAGLCSRRDAEQWIAEGRVSVNGEVLISPAFNVSKADDVRVDGEPLRAAERTRLFLFHKPRGLVTTAKDPEGRATIFDALPEELPRVVAIGRLDINTEGLLLLTNDGGLSRVLELPATGWLRRYRVRAHGEVTQEQLDALRDGISIDGVDYLGIDAKLERQHGSNVWLMMGLREGKNREIKRVLEHMGLSVNRLIRVSFGPFELADLAEGEVDEVRSRVLRDQLGLKLARQAGVNFEDPPEIVAAPSPRGDDRPRRGAEPPEPRRETEPRKRKHISVLRAQARDEAAGPRKRISRTATADRKGREVKVERVSLARPAPEPPRRRDTRPAPAEGFGPRARGGERMGGGERKPRGEFGARPSRADTGERGPKREFGARPARAEGGERKFGARPPRAEGGERKFASRPPRTEGGDRKPRGEFGARPPRADTGERGPKREFGARPARAEGGERKFGARPFRAEGGGAGNPRSEGGRPPRKGPPRKGPPRKGPPRGGPRKPRA